MKECRPLRIMMTLESFGCNGFHKCHTERFPRYIRNNHQKPMKLAYPDPSLCCTELLTEPTVTRQYIIERERDWFNIYLKIDVSDVTKKPFPVTFKIYVFYKYLENASSNSLSLHLRCWLMVLEIKQAKMYLKIRKSFTITKKKRQNTPNMPKLGGMTLIWLFRDSFKQRCDCGV